MELETYLSLRALSKIDEPPNGRTTRDFLGDACLAGPRLILSGRQRMFRGR